ncbi:DUF6084 family protein [Actinophytocola sp.]|uniref:DUF6084 family protein n=1 Tax=Actinophytocola sp. TaxID=1872138 RepID=UPI00389B2150
MVDLEFDCVGARAERFSAVPAMTLRLRIAESTGARVAAIALRCQVRIEPQRRRYSAEEAEHLHDLFGDTDRWADTVKPLQLATLSTMVPGFTGSVQHDLPLPCTYDLEIASTKYFSGLSDGVVPLLLLFSGTIFGVEDGRMAVRQVPWSNECAYPLPVTVWRETVGLHFPDSAWFRVGLDTMAALRRYKSRNALPTWDSTLAALLAEATRDASR